MTLWGSVHPALHVSQGSARAGTAPAPSQQPWPGEGESATGQGDLYLCLELLALPASPAPPKAARPPCLGAGCPPTPVLARCSAPGHSQLCGLGSSPCKRPFPTPRLTGAAQFHPVLCRQLWLCPAPACAGTARAQPHKDPTDAASPKAGQVPGSAGGSGCTQYLQLQEKVQIAAPQTPQGPTGCARHRPYLTLSPQGHSFCTHVSVVRTPGHPRLPFWSGFTWFCRQSCALVSAQCLAGHPRVSPASKGQESHARVSSFMCLTPGLL